MKERGLVAQITFEDEFVAHLASGVRTAYIGFDPTAKSLHAGSLLQLMTLKRWQLFGHRAILVAGGGTAIVGDPSGKSDMRQMLSTEKIQTNVSAIASQLKKIIDFSSDDKAILLNNADWLSKINYLDLLRDLGRYFSVNRMLSAECFKQRWEKGLTFLEFNYMILQSYDFLHLNKNFNCSVQMGGDDQWSNILAGVDLIRRTSQAKAFCLTTPLLTTSDGKKMGKTEKGAVWLDAELTSPYEYYQFWRSVEDGVVDLSLRAFTFLPMQEVNRLKLLQGSEINEAKKLLAYECTRILHGEDAARSAELTAANLFSGILAESGTEPCFEISREIIAQKKAVVDILVDLGIFSSKGEARRLIEQGGISINDLKISDPKVVFDLAVFSGKNNLVIKKGKKNFYRIVLK